MLAADRDAAIGTGRLLLRHREERDRAVFHAHCADPRVMRHLGPLQSAAETDAALARQDGYLAAHGYCFRAVERRADAATLGYCGLKPGAPETPIAGEIEIGWRFGAEHWRRGYAHEAAAASLAWAWRMLDADAIVAIAAAANAPSRALMRRLGMTRDPAADFEHPALAAASPLRGHVTYRIRRPDAGAPPPAPILQRA